ncbi:uncharacterized protein PgNI_04672, partial [Pyricularia grisea]|uniref:Uncharacterized protein n=1 Tax=Pyricularia grisea TaxID=148305 RepID=A0A6P8BDH2_PYRGI
IAKIRVDLPSTLFAPEWFETGATNNALASPGKLPDMATSRTITSNRNQQRSISIEVVETRREDRPKGKKEKKITIMNTPKGQEVLETI